MTTLPRVTPWLLLWLAPALAACNSPCGRAADKLAECGFSTYSVPTTTTTSATDTTTSGSTSGTVTGSAATVDVSCGALSQCIADCVLAHDCDALRGATDDTPSIAGKPYRDCVAKCETPPSP